MSLFFRLPHRMEDLALFTRHLAGAMQARAPLPEILRAYAIEAEAGPLARASLTLADRVESGLPLAQAIDEHPKLFPASYRRLVRLGDQGRSLGEVMRQLADNLDEGLTTYEYFRRAAVYPLLLLILLFLDLLFLLMMISPKFQAIFEELGGELPGSTQALLSSPLILIFGALLLPPIGLLIGAALGLRSRLFGYGRFALQLPLIGPVLRQAEVARFAQHLALLLHHRIPLAEALGLLADASENTYVRAATLDLQARYESGEKLASMISAQPLFPPSMATMIATAEDQGTLGETLAGLGRFYRERTGHGLVLLREAFEPLMLLLVGLLVGLILFSLYSPLFAIPRLVN